MHFQKGSYGGVGSYWEVVRDAVTHAAWGAGRGTEAWWHSDMEKAEVLRAFFTTVSTGKISIQEF